MGTHDVGKSGFFRVYNCYRNCYRTLTLVKKTLGLRFVKEIQTFASVIGSRSIVCFGQVYENKDRLPFYSL